MDELYDLDLVNLDSGEMSLQLYDHRRQAIVPLDVADPVVPVGQWFQIEAFYRNAQDSTGRLDLLARRPADRRRREPADGADALRRMERVQHRRRT